ncbi:MAG: DUF1874 domain-containing protein, partial [Casimicrobiaceae bacterium]|nr:DUF1874 domain-containing protein [Casimicrobiaceae bacterium]
ITLEQARALVASEPFESAIGHEATAQILTQLLRIEVPFRRVTYTQAPGQRALVFRLKQRLPEGEVIRSLEQLEAIGFEFGLLTREE